MKVWIICCLNLGSVLNIYKILLNFLHFAKDFEQNILKLHKRKWDSTKNNVFHVICDTDDVKGFTHISV